MKYDLEKVYEACLMLLGYKPKLAGPHAGREKHHAYGDVWLSPEGYERYVWTDDGVEAMPDPTTSLDDALPLMARYFIEVGPRFGEGDWVARGLVEVSGAYEHVRDEDEAFVELNDSAALAVCLVALRCADRDLKDFEVPE